MCQIWHGELLFNTPGTFVNTFQWCDVPSAVSNPDIAIANQNTIQPILFIINMFFNLLIFILLIPAFPKYDRIINTLKGIIK